MTEEQQDSTNNIPNDSGDTSGSLSSGKSDQIEGEKKNATDPKRSAQDPHQKKASSIVYSYREASQKKSFWANAFALGSLIINALLAIYTGLLFYQTTEQTKIAQNAVSESHSANDLARIAIDSAQAQNNRNYKLNEQALKLQIQSYENAAKLFEIENQPLLQFQDFVLKQWGKGKTIRFNYTMKNLGNHPVKLNYFKMGWAVSKDLKNIDKAISGFNKVPTAQYLTKDNPIVKIWNMKGSIPDRFYDEMGAGKYFYYFLGEVFYTNTVTGRPYKYTFVVKFDFLLTQTDLLINSNLPE